MQFCSAAWIGGESDHICQFKGNSFSNNFGSFQISRLQYYTNINLLISTISTVTVHSLNNMEILTFTDILDDVTKLFDGKYVQGLRKADIAILAEMDLHVSEQLNIKGCYFQPFSCRPIPFIYITSVS